MQYIFKVRGDKLISVPNPFGIQGKAFPEDYAQKLYKEIGRGQGLITMEMMDHTHLLISTEFLKQCTVLIQPPS